MYRHNSPGNHAAFSTRRLDSRFWLDVPLAVPTQALLAEISESPQQPADLPSARDPQPGAPAGAQPSWQPSGGALRQGNDLRPALTAGTRRPDREKPQHSLPPA